MLQAIAKIDQPLLQNVCHEVEYLLDVCRATNGEIYRTCIGYEKNFLVVLYNRVRLSFVWHLLCYQ
jgi:hypothetical protein